VDYTYFAARSDTAAAAVLDWPRGPQQPPTEEDAAGLLTDVVDGVQFSQELGRFKALLTGVNGDLEDGEHVVAETDDLQRLSRAAVEGAGGVYSHGWA
jgi:hypothetical protein